LRKPIISLTEYENEIIFNAISEGLTPAERNVIPNVTVICGKLAFLFILEAYKTDDETGKTTYVPTITCNDADVMNTSGKEKTPKGITYETLRTESFVEWYRDIEETKKMLIRKINKYMYNDEKLLEASCSSGEYW